MTITQTIDIPDDRWLKIKVPREVTANKAKVIVQFPVQKAEKPTSAAQPESSALPEEQPKIHIPINSEGKFILTKEIIDEMLQDSLLKRLTGIVHTDMTLDEIRMERLAKHL